MLAIENIQKLSSYFRTKLISLYDPAVVFSQPDITDEMTDNHCGFYVGVVLADGKETRAGFLKENLINVKESADITVQNLFAELRSKSVTIEQVKSATFYFSIVQRCIYISDPLAWNEKEDGVYFMWGDRYRGMYLPYQIKLMNRSKIEILDRLCTWECQLPSSCWRLPEGMVWRMFCQNYTS